MADVREPKSPFQCISCDTTSNIGLPSLAMKCESQKFCPFDSPTHIERSIRFCFCERDNWGKGMALIADRWSAKSDAPIKISCTNPSISTMSVGLRGSFLSLIFSTVCPRKVPGGNSRFHEDKLYWLYRFYRAISTPSISTENATKVMQRALNHTLGSFGYFTIFHICWEVC